MSIRPSKSWLRPFPNPAAPRISFEQPGGAGAGGLDKKLGACRVFYNSLGHHAEIFDAYEPLELMREAFSGLPPAKTARSGSDYR
jgi:hypothetical protein